ncbi:hypothetical protein [Bradyrhizobium ganzhouense]|uniref:hypothetical protein n=1 Tax=Bradyrhizobium ganzhouense TaxID=1179767 RepID=UPI003CE6D834
MTIFVFMDVAPKKAEAQQPPGRAVDVDEPKDEHPGVVVEADVADGAITVGIVGTVGATLPVRSGAAGVGISAAELIP